MRQTAVTTGVGLLGLLGVVLVGNCFLTTEYEKVDVPPGGGAASGSGGGAGAAGSGGANVGGTGTGGSGGTAGTGGSGGTGPAVGEVWCGNAWCDMALYHCCLPEGTGGWTGSCQGTGLCGSSNFEVECDGHEDCAGTEICCAKLGLTSEPVKSVKCAALCNPIGEETAEEVCHVGDDASCTGVDTCAQTDQLPPGYGFCMQ